MVKVAVAGGDSSIGKAIVGAIDADGTHECIILSILKIDSPKVFTVDYSKISELKDVLETHEIHTVISALSIGDDACGQAQLNLIDAAAQSRCTERFMPSEFGANYTEEHLPLAPSYAWKFKARDRLRETDLEWTQFTNSMFMDYWFAARIPSAFPLNLPNWIDLDHDFAAIPGNGDTPAVFTHSRDVSRFVVAVLGLPRWEERYFLIGDRFTINELVSIAEEIKGAKFERHYDSIELLQTGHCTLLPVIKDNLPPGVDIFALMSRLALTGKLLAQGLMDLPTERTLNSLFPEMKTLKVREAIKMYYSRS